ncbi:hypothetical protein BD626DRAFT_638570 [Schizophyllum amplum]|uniref:Uncharacterized protein n=1 Tax=Schizophyllum amplum TaxID=97359 RepID=A0A550BRN9_9AGAR|nr:hypothetical protein BD626DRAFT_638570 [Auriculariopsis ampla]
MTEPVSLYHYVYAMRALEGIRQVRTRVEMENKEEESKIAMYKERIKAWKAANRRATATSGMCQFCDKKTCEMAQFIGPQVHISEYVRVEDKWRKMRATRKKREEEEANVRDEIDYYQKAVREYVDKKDS